MADSKDKYHLSELQKRQEKALEMGGTKKVDRQHSKSRLTARERIDLLMDKGSFYEIGQLNHSELPEMREKTPADGKIGGYGTIQGRMVGVSADDVTVLAGAGGIIGYQKEHQIAQMAYERGFPLIHLGDAGGARIPDIMGAVGNIKFAVPVKERYDREVPSIAAILGECYGGPTWQASVSDIVVQVKGTQMAVVGASILEVANNDQTKNEALGDWEMHANITGAVDLFAENDREAISLIKRALSYLPSSAAEQPPVFESQSPSKFKQNSILDIIPEDDRYAYDMHQILECIFDSQSILELKPDYDGSLITAFARLDGQTVGVLANNPKINAGGMGWGACEKQLSFMILCDSFHIPMVFLHDTPGFYASRLAEEHRMPVKIMNVIRAFQHCTVPRLSVYLRRSYGMASHTMSGAKMAGDFVFAWPSADISFTAPEVAVNVVLGRKLKDAPNPGEVKKQFLEELAKMNAPWEAAGLGLIDKIIDPRHTRKELIQALKISRGTKGITSKRLMASWNKM